MNDIDFEPAPMMEPEHPVEPDFQDPQWVLDTWRALAYNFPSAGIKKRVQQAEEWVKSLAG